MKKEPRWLSIKAILAIHQDQITQHGGSYVLRDQGLLESALARPQNTFHYNPKARLVELAAAYGFGIAQNHPFVDGNKRVAFQAMYVFLGLNGLDIDTAETQVVETMLSLASGQLTQDQLTEWLSMYTKPR